MEMTNQRNRLMYRRWAPVYDAFLGRLFLPGRKRAFELLNLQAGERVLIPGVGTGQDLLFLPREVLAVGVDLSPDMLQRARQKLGTGGSLVVLVLADAQQLPVPAQAFDAAVLNLILSVVPDPQQCLDAALRALKPGGRAVIFDKFIRQEQPSFTRRLMNFFSTRIGTDINRRFADMLPAAGCTVLCDEASVGGGMYRVIVVEKDPGGM